LPQLNEAAPPPPLDADQLEAEPASRWPVVLLLLATVAVLGRLCTYEFTMWDDTWTVAQNPYLIKPIATALAYFWNPAHPQFGLFIPVTETAWRFIAAGARVSTGPAIAFLNPWVFHGANLAVHLITVVLVWKIIGRFVASAWVAAAGAAVFAIHPLQVEAVAWVSGLKDVLSGMWTMAAILLYLSVGEDGADQSGTESAIAWWGSLLCFVLAVLSKPSAMTVPLSLTAIEVLVPAGGASKVNKLWSLIRRLAPFYLIAIVVAVYAHFLQSGPDLPNPPLWARPLIACDALTFYARKLVWPANLTIDYDRTPNHVLGEMGAWLGWILPAAVAIWCWLNRRQRPVAVLAVCFFVFGCLPNLGWTRFMFQYYSTVADHYLYPSMLGAALAFALLLQWAIGPSPEPSPSPTPGQAQEQHRAQLAAVATVLVLGSWAMISFRQAGFWADDTALFEHALAINSNNFLAQNNFGVVLMEQQKDVLGAMPHFRRSIELRPTHFNSWRNLAIAEAKLNRHADAIADIRRAMELELKYPADLRPTSQDQQLLDRELAKLKEPATMTAATTREAATKSAGG
jgi:hypothetical protein